MVEQPRPRVRHLTLNTDGKRHPVENAVIAVAAVCGFVSLACAFAENLHVLGSWLGAAGIVAAVVAQYFSFTTAERMVNVVFLGASFVGFGVNLAHGGLF